MFWNGPPERFRDAFRVTKQKGDSTMSATCEVCSHEFGWELKLTIDGHGLQMSSVVHSAEEMRETADRWLCAMLEKGWTAPPSLIDRLRQALPERCERCGAPSLVPILYGRQSNP
jgi:hypothetical protein